MADKKINTKSGEYFKIESDGTPSNTNIYYKGEPVMGVAWMKLDISRGNGCQLVLGIDLSHTNLLVEGVDSDTIKVVDIKKG